MITQQQTGDVWLEPAREIPVAATVDVVVCGGGPAGVGAALAAAEAGARVLLIERHGMLGGMWTAGLLNPFFDAAGKGWWVERLIDRLRAAGAWMSWHGAATFDTEVMKSTLEDLFDEAGITFWYHSLAVGALVVDGRMRGVVVESKSGREAVRAQVVVDCTGDGDIAARAGASFDVGRPSDGLCQPVTLMCELTGVGDAHQRSSQGLYDAMSEAIRREELDVRLPFERCNYAPWIIHLPRPDTADMQATHAYGVSALDTRAVTRATVECRRQAQALVGVLRHLEGTRAARVAQSAGTLGIRESRHIHGDYTLTLEDLQAGRRFEDAVTFGAFGVDIHSVKGAAGDPGSRHDAPIRPYEIPYRCLLPRGVEGLLVAGRCISGTHEAHASYRVTGTCMGMGQAAGLAAATAAAAGTAPRALNGAALRAALIGRGVGLLP